MLPRHIQVNLLLDEPKPIHDQLYDSGKMGYSCKEFDEDRCLAVLMLTLAKISREGLDKPSKVTLLVPKTHDKWLIEQLDNVNKRMCDRLRTFPGTKQKRRELTTNVLGCFNNIWMFSRVLQMVERPTYWTAFGFSKEDVLPDWMQGKLL